MMQGRQLAVVLMCLILITPALGTATSSDTHPSQITTLQDSDEWPDESDEASEIRPGEYTGEIATSDDEDHLQLPVEAGDTVTITLDKEIRKDTHIYLNWPGGDATLNNESGGKITRKITADEAGEISIEISSDTVGDNGPEPWTLSVDRAADTDKWTGGDDADNFVESNSSYSGVVNSPDDIDSLKLRVDKGDTTAIEFSKEIRKDTHIYLNWPGGDQTLSDESAETLSRRVTVEEEGIIRFEIESDSVEITPENWSLSLRTEPDTDVWNDSAGIAEEVNPDTQYEGKISSPDDDDYLQVPIEKGDSMALGLKKQSGANIDMYVNWPGGDETLQDEESEILTRRITAEQNGFVTVEIGSNGMEAAERDWTFETALFPGIDSWNDNYGSADQVEVNAEYAGSINSPDDADHLEVPVEEGDTVTVSMRKGTGAETEMYVNWPGGDETLHDEDAETVSRSMTVEENGFISIEITNSNVGMSEAPWTIAIEEGTAADPPELATLISPQPAIQRSDGNETASENSSD